MVGVRGFEPPTPCSQSRCANRTALHPDVVDYGMVPDHRYRQQLPYVNCSDCGWRVRWRSPGPTRVVVDCGGLTPPQAYSKGIRCLIWKKLWKQGILRLMVQARNAIMHAFSSQLRLGLALVLFMSLGVVPVWAVAYGEACFTAEARGHACCAPFSSAVPAPETDCCTSLQPVPGLPATPESQPSANSGACICAHEHDALPARAASALSVTERPLLAGTMPHVAASPHALRTAFLTPRTAAPAGLAPPTYLVCCSFLC